MSEDYIRPSLKEMMKSLGLEEKDYGKPPPPEPEPKKIFSHSIIVTMVPQRGFSSFGSFGGDRFDHIKVDEDPKMIMDMIEIGDEFVTLHDDGHEMFLRTQHLKNYLVSVRPMFQKP